MALMQILLIEDDDSIREVFKLLLELEKPFGSLQVEAASNGQVALEAVKRQRPDIVLLDLSLPGEHGFEIFKKMRTLPECADLPFIAVTAHNLPDLEKEAYSLGFEGFVTKPIDFEGTLFPCMKKLLARHASGHHAA